MHRYLAGVAKPAVKRVLRDWDNLYDMKLKDKCGYLKSWETEYTWLSHDNQQLVIFCALCRRYPTTGICGKNAFIAGTELWSVGGACTYNHWVQAWAMTVAVIVKAETPKHLHADELIWSDIRLVWLMTMLCSISCGYYLFLQ